MECADGAAWVGVVGGDSVDEGGEGSCVEGVKACGEECPCDSGEDVAGAGGSEPGGCVGLGADRQVVCGGYD